MRRFIAILAACLISYAGNGCLSAQTTEDRNYQLEYHIKVPADGMARVTLRVRQQQGELKRLVLHTRGQGLTDLPHALLSAGADGAQVWQVPRAGGELSWRAPVARRRADGSVDALTAADWALFRIEHLLPPIGSVTRPGAVSQTRMRIEVPKDWSVVTAYKKQGEYFLVEDRGRRFDRPDGWVLIGDIGVRRDQIANTRVSVAAPRGLEARRLDVMAFLNWHLPLLRNLFADFPDRLLIAMAGDPFFRGGLSAPNSLFLHTDRPLISGNGTSTLLHELFHVGLSRTAATDADWIVEGLAEYYSQQLLYRAGSVTGKRHRDTLQQLASWSKQADSLPARQSSGARTALAVGVFVALDREIRRHSNDKASLDQVVQLLARSDDVLSLEDLRDAARELLGRDARSLSNKALPGY